MLVLLTISASPAWAVDAAPQPQAVTADRIESAPGGDDAAPDAKPQYPAPAAILLLIGINCLIALLIASLFNPDPTPVQTLIVRAVLALGVGFFGGALPEAFDLEAGSMWDMAQIQAGCILALFLLVYLSKPDQLFEFRTGEEDGERPSFREGMHKKGKRGGR